MQNARRQHPSEVLAAQSALAGRCANFQRAIEEIDQRNVKCAAAQIEDEQSFFVVGLVKSVRDCCRGGLVENAFNGQAGDLARRDSRLALPVVEIGRHGDHCPRHFLAEESFGVGLERAENQAGQLLGSEFPPAEGGDPVGPHMPLEDRSAALGPCHTQFAGRSAYQQLACVVQADDRRSQNIAQGIGNQLWPVVGHVTDGAIGRSKINADDPTHGRPSSRMYLE